MPYFRYTAVDDSGKQVKGGIESPSREEVARRLQEIGFRPTEIRTGKPPRAGSFKIPLMEKKVPTEKLIIFTRQFISILRAGIPMLQGLQILASQTDYPKLKKALMQITLDVEGGKDLSESMEKFPYVFPTTYITTIQAGEVTGTLPELLEELALYLEFDLETVRNIKAAVRYPIMVIVAIVIAFSVVMTFVIPKFASIFAQYGAALPLPTKIMLFFNDIFHKYWFAFLSGSITFIIGCRLFVMTEFGHLMWDKVSLRIPIIGKILKKATVSRFSRLFGTLYKSGIPILNAFNVIRQTLDNRLLRQEVDLMADSVSRGSGISSAMKGSRIFPPMVHSMISIGETSGSLDRMLDEISLHYDSEVRYAVKNLNSLIEPLLLVFLAIAVLFLALAIFLPMWRVYKIIS